MNQQISMVVPRALEGIEAATKSSGFSMASDRATGTLLRALAASKPAGRLLELGTGTGLGCSWILDGMSANASLISVEMDHAFISIAREALGADPRLCLIQQDGESWLNANGAQKFDFIFADTWPGKYITLDETLDMLLPGAIYIIDDMLPQTNWPEGHAQKAENLVKYLLARQDMVFTELHWSTGIMIGVKK
jgi:predicted O-methyltransferase YrrM